VRTTGDSIVQAISSVTSDVVAGSVDAVQLLGQASVIRLWNRSPADMYVRIDSVDPVAMGDKSALVPSGEHRDFQVIDTVNPEIRIVSTAAVVASRYMVERIA